MSDNAIKSISSAMEKLARGKAVYENFFQQHQLYISGHPIEHWVSIFRIKIPNTDLNPSILKELDVKVMDLSQEASFFLACAQAKSQLLHKNSEIELSERFLEIYESYKDKGKVPAASILESLAKTAVVDSEYAFVFSDIEVKFWKNILEHLNTCRKLIENASLNISVELKATMNEGYIDALNRSKNERY
jgi:hypothetical protein